MISSARQESIESIEHKPENQAIFVVKPCGIEKIIGAQPLVRVLERLFESVGLGVVSRTEKLLNEKDVRDLYSVLNRPDPVFGEGWKVEVIDHMTKGHVTAYILEGVDAEQKAKVIRNTIRTTLIPANGDWRDQRVSNFVHVVDEEDFLTSYKALYIK